jgi:hypothetical protein
MRLKSFLFTLAIFCGGYVSNTLLDSAVEAAQAYFHFQTSTYKTDSNGYIICSIENPKITNDNLIKRPASMRFLHGAGTVDGPRIEPKILLLDRRPSRA